MSGFWIALLSGALMSIQGIFNTDVTKQNGPRFKAKRGPFFFPGSADHGRRIPAAVSHFR